MEKIVPNAVHQMWISINKYFVGYHVAICWIEDIMHLNSYIRKREERVIVKIRIQKSSESIPYSYFERNIWFCNVPIKYRYIWYLFNVSPDKPLVLSPQWWEPKTKQTLPRFFVFGVYNFCYHHFTNSIL